jgi:hypothetical protein
LDIRAGLKASEIIKIFFLLPGIDPQILGGPSRSLDIKPTSGPPGRKLHGPQKLSVNDRLPDVRIYAAESGLGHKVWKILVQGNSFIVI